MNAQVANSPSAGRQLPIRMAAAMNPAESNLFQATFTAALSLQLRLIEGNHNQARTLVSELLAMRIHPVFIVKEAVIPAVEASGTGLKDGNFQMYQLPPLGISLQAVMENIKIALPTAGPSLQFRVGKARDDIFDLWGAVIVEAFDAAGFATSRIPEWNRCEVTTVCEIAKTAMKRNDIPCHPRASDCLSDPAGWHNRISMHPLSLS